MPGMRHASRRGLDAGDATKMRGQANAAGGIAAETEGGSACCDQRSFAAARTPGRLRQIVGIVGASAKQVVAFKREEKIGKIGRRDGEGAGGAEPPAPSPSRE